MLFIQEARAEGTDMHLLSVQTGLCPLNANLKHLSIWQCSE